LSALKMTGPYSAKYGLHSCDKSARSIVKTSACARARLDKIKCRIFPLQGPSSIYTLSSPRRSCNHVSAASLVGNRAARAILPINDPWQTSCRRCTCRTLWWLTARAFPRLPHVAIVDPGLSCRHLRWASSLRSSARLWCVHRLSSTSQHRHQHHRHRHHHRRHRSPVHHHHHHHATQQRGDLTAQQ